MTKVQLNKGRELRLAANVATELDIPLHRLRSWENFYPLFRAEKEEGGQRYYSEYAVSVARRIAELLYRDGVKSHEVMSRLQKEGFGQMGGISGRQEPTNLEETMTALREENARLGKQLEDFGHIALSLKAIEDENQQLKAELAAERSSGEGSKSSSGGTDSAAYLAELESENLQLQENIEQLTSLVERQKQDTVRLKTLEAELERHTERYRALEKAHQDLRAASAPGGEESEQRRLRQEKIEEERRVLVEKLEKAVLIMQSLEDENIRLKRSLHDALEGQTAQGNVSEEYKALEAEITQLKQRLDIAKKEAASQVQGAERLASLESDNMSLRQKLAAYERRARAYKVGQNEVKAVLRAVIEEVTAMKKSLSH